MSRLLCCGGWYVGESAKEAIDDFISAYETMQEFYHKKGKKFVEAKFDFQYDLAKNQNIFGTIYFY